MSEQIPGFTIQDGDGKVIAMNPGQSQTGRRAYKDGEQIERDEDSRARNTHQYLFRCSKGIWKAFSRKCDNEGISARQGLEYLVKDWVTGKIEIQDLATRD